MSSKLSTLIDWSIKSHRLKLHDFLATLQEKPYWIEIKPYRKNRTKEANSYWWVGVIKPVCDFHGFNSESKEHRDMIHEKLKLQFNSEEIVFKKEVFKSSLDSGIGEFNEVYEYLERKDWKPDVLDGCVLFPPHILKSISRGDLSHYGEFNFYIAPPVKNGNSVSEFDEFDKMMDGL